jgi:hypothetical protein
MTATNHAITGAVIALAVKQPVLAIPLAFLSHYLVDVIPHFEARDLPKRWSQIFIGSDLAVFFIGTLSVLFFLHFKIASWIVAASMSAAALPDFAWIWRYLRIRDLDKTFDEPMSSLSRLHLKIQISESLRGIWIEAAWFIAALALIIKLQ